MTPDLAGLFEAAKGYILSSCVSRTQSFTSTHTANDDSQATSISTSTSTQVAEKLLSIQAKKFPNIFSKVIQYQHHTGTGTDFERPFDLQNELNRYTDEVKSLRVEDSFTFWKERQAVYTFLAPVAEDFLAAPASEAYVERIFSLTGYLSSGRRNRMAKSLNMRAFLKLNKVLA